MEMINITSIFKISLILLFFGLSACGGSGDSSPPPDPAEGNKWGEMEWGKGTWGQ